MLPSSLADLTHRDLFLRDDGNGVRSPHTDGCVASGLCGLEGVLCFRTILCVKFRSRVSFGIDVTEAAESKERNRSRATGGREILKEARSFRATMNRSMMDQPPSFFLRCPRRPLLVAFRRLTDLVEPAIRGKDGDVAVVAATGATRHDCKRRESDDDDDALLSRLFEFLSKRSKKKKKKKKKLSRLAFPKKTSCPPPPLALSLR